MTKMLKAAVIGYGYWGPNLARNFAISPDFELDTICDLDPGRLRQAAVLYPGVRMVQSVAEVLASDPDLVAVAIPVAAHYEVARRCLEAGAHVFVEKPFTATVEEGEKLLELAQQLGKSVFVDHTFLFTGAVEEMKKQIASGNLGDMLYVDSVRINLGLFQPDVDVIWDLAPHDLSILRYLMGRAPHTVSAMGSCHNPQGTVDVGYLHLDYGDAVTAHLHLSWLSPVKVRRMIFAGTRQSLIFDDLDHDEKIKLYDHGVGFDVADVENRRRILVSYRKGDMRAPAVPPTEALAVQMKNVAAAIRDGAVPRSQGVDGLSVVRILSAASESLQLGGKAVRVGAV